MDIPLPPLLLAQLLPYLPATARVAGLIAAAPVFSSGLIPAPVRVSLALAFALALGGLAPPLAAGGALPGGVYLGMLLAEVAVGLALGLAARLLMESLTFAGQMLELQIGLHAGALFDPASGQQTSQLGQLYQLAGMLLFLELGGHHWLLHAVAASFQAAPPGQIAISPNLLPLIAGLGTCVFRLALQVAAPIAFVLFLVDLAFGVIGRTVPQMNVFAVEIPAKLAVGLVAMIVCTPLLLGVMSSLLGDMRVVLEGMLRALSG
ncbi:MAG TPA: flagellar biosynthetic protein FliR [Armatimonadota bacterium]|jgi:flagellar biosynthetic protein FliR